MAAPATAPYPAPLPPGTRVHTVWEVCQRVGHLLARDDLLPSVWVRGEVSNARVTPGGHLVFTLKDPHAQLTCLLWREEAERLPFEVKDGLALLVHGSVRLYDQRGTVQLYADELVPDGVGRLHLAYQQLRERLAKEGLFDDARKRPLPAMPQRIGLVTSLQGAALHDMLRILATRFPLATVVVRPVRVQGDGAALEIAAAIRLFNRVQAADVLIVGRGGGSLEDLWAFNEEAVARAIHASAIPVLSAVGHETDVTIADFVADLRAPTPSGAAEMVVPDQQELRRALDTLHRALLRRASHQLQACRERLAAWEQRVALREPARLLDAWRQRLEEAAERLEQAQARDLAAREERLARLAGLLDSYSPLRTLQRGYAIVSVEGRPATRVAQLPPGTRARLQVADGEVQAVVWHGG